MGLLGRGNQFHVQCSLEQGQEDPSFMALFSVPPGCPSLRQAQAWLPFGVSSGGKCLPLCGVPPYNHLVGLMLPPAWCVTGIVPGTQPSSRKSLVTFEG